MICCKGNLSRECNKARSVACLINNVVYLSRVISRWRASEQVWELEGPRPILDRSNKLVHE